MLIYRYRILYINLYITQNKVFYCLDLEYIYAPKLRICDNSFATGSVN